MVRRIMAILDECKTVWPLATRWYDHLDKFYNDQKGVTLDSEGTMADSVSINSSPKHLHKPMLTISSSESQSTTLFTQPSATHQNQSSLGSCRRHRKGNIRP